MRNMIYNAILLTAFEDVWFTSRTVQSWQTVSLCVFWFPTCSCFNFTKMLYSVKLIALLDNVSVRAPSKNILMFSYCIFLSPTECLFAPVQLAQHRQSIRVCLHTSATARGAYYMCMWNEERLTTTTTKIRQPPALEDGLEPHTSGDQR